MNTEVIQSGDLSVSSGNIPDTGQQLGQFLDRWINVLNGSLSAANTALTEVFNFDPYERFLTNLNIVDKIAKFSYFSGELEVMIMIVTPPNAYGIYVFSYMPYGTGALADTEVYKGGMDLGTDDIAVCFQNTHVVLNPAEATTAILKIPFVYDLEALKLPYNISVIMGLVHLYCISPLQNATGASAITSSYRVYIRAVPGYKLVTATNQMNRGPKSDMGGFSSNISSLGDLVAKAPVITPGQKVIAAGLKGAGTLLSMMGFTREQDSSNPMPVIQRTLTNIMNFDGHDARDVFALSASNTVTIDPRIGGSTNATDPASLDNLYPRWTFLRTVNWSSVDTVFSQLISIPVGPGVSYYDGAYYPSPAGYVGMGFAYWAGDMEYMIIIGGSQFHRGLLQISWDPEVVTASTDITQTTNNVIIDLKDSSSRIFKVGYTSNQPALKMSIAPHNTIAGNTNYFNGYLRIQVAGTLTSSIMPTAVTVMVLHRAGSNMKFGVPSSTFITEGVNKSIALNMAVAQMDRTKALGEAVHEVVSYDLTNNCGKVIPVVDFGFGEDFTSVRALAQKPSCVFSNQNISNQLPGIMLPHFLFGRQKLDSVGFPNCFQIMAEGSTGLNTYWTTFSWFGHISMMFVGVRGSVSVHVASFHEAEVSSFASFHPDEFYLLCQSQAITGFGNLYGTPPPTNNGAMFWPNSLISTLPNGGYAMLFPYYEKVKYITPYGNRLFSNTNLLVVAPTVQLGRTITFGMANGSRDFSVFYSGGPDIAFIQFRRTPRVYVVASPTAGS